MTAASFIVNGIAIPYYHFVYHGDLYKYLRIRNNKLLGDGTRINEFFLKKSYEQYEFTHSFYHFKKSMLIIIHYFTDLNKRDLDNNSYKPLIDGIKKTGVFGDDNWQELSLMVLGNIIKVEDLEERIEAFVIPHDYFIEFLSSKVLPSKMFKQSIKDNISLKKNFSSTR